MATSNFSEDCYLTLKMVCGMWLQTRLTQRYSVRGCFPIKPEGNPRYDDQENAGTVHLNYEVAHVPL